MARLTKAEIEQSLLKGDTVEWKDANGKSASITLDSAKQRRLFVYLKTSRVRDVKSMSDEFVNGLAEAYAAVGDPAAEAEIVTTSAIAQGPWKIHSLMIEGFGGVNTWKGAPFELKLSGESLLIEGPNGSGKSSLTAAIVWTLSGERPRDQNDGPSEEAKPVFGKTDAKAGDWPPVATYPTDLTDIHLGPNVTAEVTFSNSLGTLAKATRAFDGKKMTFTIDPALQIPSILLETGLLMPSRLPKLRFDEGKGRLSDAVQTLTGLDELVELGAFIQGLCHKGRDYLSYKSTELAAAKAEFERQIEAAKKALTPVSINVPNFKPRDTEDPNGDMAKLGKALTDKASDLTKVVSDDLAPGLNLGDAQIQKQLMLALAGAEADLALGLDNLSLWKTLQTITGALGKPDRKSLREKLSNARKALVAAIGYHEKAQADTRYRLKAAAARWHAEHGDGGAIEQCPACTQSLEKMPELRDELVSLQSAGEAATRQLSDNINGIMAELESALPQTMRRYLSDPVPAEPRATLITEIKKQFIDAELYSKYLVKFGALVVAAHTKIPPSELTKITAEPDSIPDTAAAVSRIAKIELLCSLADWFEDEKSSWESWWRELSITEALPDGATPKTETETLSAHIQRLGKSLGEAEPFRLGAEAMRVAWKQGAIASKIERELTQRQEIAGALAPLKSLGNLAEAQARDALTDLSTRIGQIHSATYLSDALRFQSATLERKAGLVVRGQLADEIRIDATLVANTSWIRGVLWAFIFALREEAVQQMGGDQFPVMVLDDPQQTFDSVHRHRWAEYIAHLQKLTPGVQILLATHDEQFLSFLKIDGVTGRRALITSAGSELGHIGFYEGDDLDRRWYRVLSEQTPKAAQDYMAAVRVFVEGMLKLMLRGEDIDVSTSVIGGCREKLSFLHKAKMEPWARQVFGNLVNALGKNVSAIKYIELSHHTDGALLGMTEAVDVNRYWTKRLHIDLERAFRIAREHRALHGSLTALHAMPATVELPDGHKEVVSALTLPLIGSAAALSNGRAADGCVNLNIDGSVKETVILNDHIVYRLTSPTIEPAARPGDLLLVSQHAAPTAKSLVVARDEDRLLARRLEIADNHSDVAVLTANAINPRRIAPPVVAKLSTVSMHKVVGVVYDHEKSALGKQDEHEICDCGGETYVKAAFSDMQGLVEVSGHSAEPHALDKQFLIIGNAVPLALARSQLEGHPIIAEDSNGDRFFKRLRNGGSDVVILESLEIGGDFSPIVLITTPAPSLHLKTIWPVLGVLFERPK